MADLTKIERPYALCTKEEQKGLNSLVGIEGALQFYSMSGEWEPLSSGPSDLAKVRIYRQNPDWHLPKLDVPDWFWENSTASWVAMDKSELFYGYIGAPRKGEIQWIGYFQNRRLIDCFFTHNFNPHNVPWDKSLTKRPGLIE